MTGGEGGVPQNDDSWWHGGRAGSLGPPYLMTSLKYSPLYCKMFWEHQWFGCLPGANTVLSSKYFLQWLATMDVRHDTQLTWSFEEDKFPDPLMPPPVGFEPRTLNFNNRYSVLYQPSWVKAVTHPITDTVQCCVTSVMYEIPIYQLYHSARSAINSTLPEPVPHESSIARPPISGVWTVQGVA